MNDDLKAPPPLKDDVIPSSGAVLFYPTAPWKFILLNLCSLGLYQLYWAYKCWAFIRDNGRSDISPFWRAVFSPIWFYSLGREINESTNKPKLVFLALAYFAITLCSYLPDPYWLISLLSFLPFLVLLKDVNGLNMEPEVRAASNYSRFKFKHIALTAGGGALTAFIVASSLSFIPSTQVVSGDVLPSWHKSYMIEIGAMGQDEEIQFFYSMGLWSFKEDGNYFTDKSVGSYWEDPYDSSSGVEVANFSEVASIDIEYSDLVLEDTLVTVVRIDGSEFELYISNELDRDHLFVDTLLEFWNNNRN